MFFGVNLCLTRQQEDWHCFALGEASLEHSCFWVGSFCSVVSLVSLRRDFDLVSSLCELDADVKCLPHRPLTQLTIQSYFEVFLRAVTVVAGAKIV